MSRNQSRNPSLVNPTGIAAPPATLDARVRWRDPRLWVGVVLVAGSVVTGSRVLAAADDSVAVWAAAAELAPGATLAADDLEVVRVRFDDDVAGTRYLAVSDTLPSDLTLVRGIGEGELVPAAALGGADDAGLVRVSVALDAEHVPSDLRAGSLVDLWLLGEGRNGATRASRVLGDVVVVDLPAADTGWSTGGGTRQVVVGLPEHDDDAVAAVVAASSDGTVRLTARG